MYSLLYKCLMCINDANAVVHRLRCSSNRALAVTETLGLRYSDIECSRSIYYGIATITRVAPFRSGFMDRLRRGFNRFPSAENQACLHHHPHCYAIQCPHLACNFRGSSHAN